MSDSELQFLLIRINLLRKNGEATREGIELEEKLEKSYQPSHRLAVYGTLAPGRSNHDQIKHVYGNWRSDVYVEGEWITKGWGAKLGYPAIRWQPGGERVNSFLLISELLPQHWERLDRFEGSEYYRILIPVFDSNGFHGIANLYASR